MKLLEGKTALVTGATSGIGRAAAITLAGAGAKVVASGRRAELGESLVAEIAERGDTAHFMQCDVTDEAQVKALVDETTGKFGSLDIAVNNAGVEGETGPLVDQSTENYDFIMNANVKGVFFSLKHEIAWMVENGKPGSIINMSSVAGQIGFPGASVYVASKHAVNGLTRTAALEVAQQGIRVNAIAPGAVQTDMIDRFSGGSEEGKEMLKSMHPVGRIGTPGEIAESVLFLAGDGSSFVTGQVLPVDGGLTTA